MAELPEILEDSPSQEVILRDALAAQHPLFGMMGNVFIKLGGEAFLEEWAEEHPGQFIGYLFKGTPSIAPSHAIMGDVNISINGALIPTDLDSVTLDSQGRVIDG